MLSGKETRKSSAKKRRRNFQLPKKFSKIFLVSCQLLVKKEKSCLLCRLVVSFLSTLPPIDKIRLREEDDDDNDDNNDDESDDDVYDDEEE